MTNPSPIQRRQAALARWSLVLGLAALVIAALFTLATAFAVITGNAAFLESSRSLNGAYLALSLAGEAMALAGLAAAASAIWLARRLAALPTAALLLNALTVMLFLPASLAFVFNGLMALLD